ncbi:MAG: C-GCAxxG-C-C family protein [Anaerolineae bacterium]|jgi:hypothetical protein
MDIQSLVRERVHDSYWTHDWNCAVTTLRILAEVFSVDLDHQVLDAAVGMHGAGGYRAQCGLVEGALMFIGIISAALGASDDTIAQTCYNYALEFEDRFSSLVCRQLRPEGFRPDNPPHLCEDLTREAVLFDIEYMSYRLSRKEEME